LQQKCGASVAKKLGFCNTQILPSVYEQAWAIRNLEAKELAKKYVD
jgi:hypothetical protein